MVKKCFLFLLLFRSTVYGWEIVNVVNSTNNPVNVTGSFAITPPAVTTVTFNGASQPISGTVTCNAGTGYFVTNQSTVAVMNTSGGNLKVDGSAFPQPVTGTFWPVTQPVSGTGSFNVNQSTVAMMNTAGGTIAVISTATTISNTVTVIGSGAFNVNQSTVGVMNTAGGTLAVISTATTVSGTVTANAGTGPFNVNQSTVAVMNTAGATLAISGSISNTGFNVNNSPTVTANAGTGSFNVNQSTVAVMNTSGGTIAISGSISNTGFNVNNSPTVTANAGTGSFNVNQSTVAVMNVVGSSLSVSGTVTSNIGSLPTLTKGSQGATGLTTQDLKDAGRTYVVLVATGITGVTTEALFSFQQSKQGVITQTVSSYVIANGKTLRIQGLHCSSRDGAAAISWGRFVLRHNPSGTTIAASPLIFAVETGGAAALAGSAGAFTAPFPDGLEIFGNGTQSIGVSHLDSATTNVDACTLVGYEY